MRINARYFHETFRGKPQCHSAKVTRLFENKNVCYKIMFIGLSSILTYQIDGGIFRDLTDLGFLDIVLLHVTLPASLFSILCWVMSQLNVV